MRAVTYQGVRRVSVEDVPKPVLQSSTDAIIRVTLSAICGSDLHVFHGRIRGMEPGDIVGHEYVGTVEQLGDDVKLLTPGSRVLGSFFTACGHCWACRMGFFTQCIHSQLFGFGSRFGNLSGAQAQWVRVPYADQTLRPLPESITDEQGILIEDILSTAYFATQRGNIVAGDIVAVIGAGPVGLLSIQMAYVFGASLVVALDLVPQRLEQAQRLGAHPLLVNGKEGAITHDLTNGRGVDVVIEAVGSGAGLDLASRLARPFATISAAGVFTEPSLPLPMGRIFAKDLTLRSGMANVMSAFGPVMALVENGRLKPEVVITHRMPLEASEEAYQIFDQKEAMKIILLAD